MGLFSKLFGGILKATYDHPQLGRFTLVYSKNGRNLWVSSKAPYLGALGSKDEPYREHLEFLRIAESEVAKLNHIILKRFLDFYEEAEEEIRFSDWKEKFKIEAIDVESIQEGKPYWNITFEELHEPYYHYILYFEGQEPKDISIDS